MSQPPSPTPGALGGDAGARLLVVDDDAEIRDLLGRFLRRHGYQVASVRSGAEMREALAAAQVDLIVLDLMLTDGSGLDLCRDLRAGGSAVPVIMLTAMGDDADRIVGLELGADDYIAKPFNPRELLARVRAVLRRTGGTPGTTPRGGVLRFAGWSLDPVRRELCSPDGAITDLTAGEYDLLLAFLEHPRRVLNRDQLLDLTRGRTAQPFDRAVDVQVSRLRRKLEPDPARATIIKTIRGAGYVFTPAVETG